MAHVIPYKVHRRPVPLSGFYRHASRHEGQYDAVGGTAYPRVQAVFHAVLGQFFSSNRGWSLSGPNIV
jgi:hypothetical protein